jgi:alkylated DNA repair dioxygenase AlkB
MIKYEQIKCACKGIRTCVICEDIKKPKMDKYDKILNLNEFIEICNENILNPDENDTNIKISKFSIGINKISEVVEHSKYLYDNIFNHLNILATEIDLIKNNIHFNKDSIFEGFYVIKNILTEEEKKNLVGEINSNQWNESQSGRKKQDYGPKINYKKRKVKMMNIEKDNLNTQPTNIPSYIDKYICNKFKFLLNLSDFNIAGVGNLFYIKENGSHIDPHIDDYWIWGGRIIGINLLSNTVMTFSKEIEIESELNSNKKKVLFEIDIPIDEGDMYIMSNEARYFWQHSIKKENIFSDRMVITIREFENEFRNKINL